MVQMWCVCMRLNNLAIPGVVESGTGGQLLKLDPPWIVLALYCQARHST